MLTPKSLVGSQPKSEYADNFASHEFGAPIDSRPRSASSSRMLERDPSDETNDAPERSAENDEPDPDENTSLLHKDRHSTFARRMSPHAHQVDSHSQDAKRSRVFGYEQDWSWSMPAWTWVLQFIILAPIPVILVGQVGLLFMSGVHQTLADGNAALPVYLGAAVFTILVLAPLVSLF